MVHAYRTISSMRHRMLHAYTMVRPHFLVCDVSLYASPTRDNKTIATSAHAGRVLRQVEALIALFAKNGF